MDMQKTHKQCGHRSEDWMDAVIMIQICLELSELKRRTKSSLMMKEQYCTKHIILSDLQALNCEDQLGLCHSVSDSI